MQEKELRINVKSVWYSLACMVGTFCFHRVFLTYERYVNSCHECLQLPLSDERI